MRLASKFLTALEGNFDSSQVEKAFFETNQLFLSQSDVSDEDISDLLDVCKESFLYPILLKTNSMSNFGPGLNLHTIGI